MMAGLFYIGVEKSPGRYKPGQQSGGFSKCGENPHYKNKAGGTWAQVVVALLYISVE